MHRWLLTFLALTLLAVAGCVHKPTVVGKWTGKMFDQDVAAEFKEDKSMTVEVKAGTMAADFTGTYEMDEKSLSITLKDYKLQNVDKSLVSMADQMLSPLKDKLLKGTYHFNNDDELAITYNSKTDVIKRVKDAA